ncbi:hypothetical protein SADUNF_Sadunf15G0102900 [Salix dunnii]|uniref:Uncharacterized protein n=1 Tax=Salix dunnii TaxID=1413687 RepID=A0A835JGQ7_9ROSI|nr:hypothetical protein SADUNF_Sadunf15G0102900 [Salix dunnii]
MYPTLPSFSSAGSAAPVILRANQVYGNRKNFSRSIHVPVRTRTTRENPPQKEGKIQHNFETKDSFESKRDRMVSGGEDPERKAQAGICIETCRGAYKKRTSAAEDNTRHEPPSSPLFIATSNGVVEIAQEILDKFPQSIELVNQMGQNILHLTVKHRQRMSSTIDHNGYTLLHQVAHMKHYHGRTKPCPALELHEEIKWFKDNASAQKNKQQLANAYLPTRLTARKMRALRLAAL